MTRILVASDLSQRSDRALRRAVRLAAEQPAELVAVHVVDDDQPARMIELECREAGAILDETIAAAVAGGPRPHVMITTGEPFDGILRAAASQCADLIVMGSHRRRLLGGVFAGTTAERVIRRSALPVLMVNTEPQAPYLHVLAATDLSDTAADALRAARDLGLLARARLGLLCAFDPAAKGLLTLATTTDHHVAGYVEAERERMRAAARVWIAANGLPMVASLDIVESPPAAAIAAAAEAGGFDLVVVGTAARRGVARLMLGSVAGEVLRLVDRDILAVPPPKDCDVPRPEGG